ncbi:unnamed protein product [Phytophthora lilii]|uniref:Unnamed protein product n=1 Tax=Phytophthora lilii TaxID=2077276 RepID=A0A9W6TPZ7_9STRA|nr:unnamed protein product [Phytophthora lilii]
MVEQLCAAHQPTRIEACAHAATPLGNQGEMARTGAEPPRSAAHVLSWLRRRRPAELPVERALQAVRSAAGVVPLGGRVGGADGATPPATPKTAALALFSAAQPPRDDADTRWTLLVDSCQLPAAGDARAALEAMRGDEHDEPLQLDQLRRRFFAERRDFFAARIELLRVARDAQHPNKQAAAEAVDELLKEGLRDALLDELHGRQFCQPPTFAGVGADERRALVAWELQLLQEEALLRELLLLTLVASRERPTLDCALKIARTVHNWEFRVFDEVFTPSTLMLPAAQEAAKRVTQIGLLVALRLLHTAGAAQEQAALQRATNGFFLTELCGLQDGMSDAEVEAVASPVSGVLLLSWAALLGRQYRAGCNRSTEETAELETMLQQTLAAAERLHSFHYLNALLRSLVFHDDYANSDNVGCQPFLQPLSLHAKLLWELPDVNASSGLHSQYLSSDSASTYQHVVASFLNDMLLVLGYTGNLENAQQLHVMVKFVLPALSNVDVAQQTLGIDVEDSGMVDIIADGALRELLTKTRASLPDSLLPCVEMLTALCCNYRDFSSPAVLHQVLKYFGKPFTGLEGRLFSRRSVCRQLPPPEYFEEVVDNHDRVQCTRSFAYEDGEKRLVVPAGTMGNVLRSADEVRVEWLVVDDSRGTDAPCLWDLIMLRADNFVSGLQSGAFSDLHRTNAEDVKLLTAFFEFIVQLGQQHDGGTFELGDVERRWGEARLRRWWLSHQLPSLDVLVDQLVRQQVALPMLLSASRENLVSWGITDRYTREQILAQLGDVGSISAGSVPSVTNNTSDSINSFALDGGIHLIRLLLGVLDGFLRAPPIAAIDDSMGDGESAWSTEHLHLVTASFIALRTFLATPGGVDLLMSPLISGGQEECVSLIVKSAKKLFELQERLAGVYPVVLATQEIFMSVVRWFLSKEAQTLANPATGAVEDCSVGSHAFVAMERLWFVGAAEFAIEVLSTHESWKFVSTSQRCEVTERCFRLLYVLVLPRKYVSEQNEMIPAFEVALRQTLSTDMSLLMKLLRSSCAVMEGHMSHWNSIAITDDDDEEDSSNVDKGKRDDHSLLVYESELHSAGINLVQLESQVVMCLRFVALLVATQATSIDAQAAREILLTPIDDGGPKKRKSLTIVTLCGGYLDYSVEKTPEIAYWSLQILQHAAVMLDYRQERESHDLSSLHSLVALFHGYQDLPLVRGMFARLLRAPTQYFALRKEVIEMLTLCLEHQPGFLALLLFGEDKKDSAKFSNSDGDPLPFVALLERFFEASEQLLEKSSDLFCALLAFLVQVWKGAIHHGLGVHLKIMSSLRERSTFWPNVTRALKIHMPLESGEERGLLDTELAAATIQGRGDVESPSEAYIGRSSAYGYLARGLILQLVSYEWHNKAAKESDHPLVDVLESFRKEGLYSHWLRTFTRLDYSPAQLKLYALSIRRACNLNAPSVSILDDLPVGGISLYLQGLICDASALKWQLSAGESIKQQASPADVRSLKLVQWGNLQAAYLHAQLFLLTKWKVFMELCSLQAGGATESTPSESTTPRRLKRKESMISSPPRSSVMSSAGSASSSSRTRLIASASSPSSSESVLGSSRFSGDRTSFGMIQVLADVIKTRVMQHENQDEVLDYFVLLHLQNLVQLLVSMLHHQLCLVVRKTRDPKLSQTRQRLEGSNADLKLNAGATLELLAIIDKTTSAVRESIERIAREVELARLNGNDRSNTMSSSSSAMAAVPLIACLVANFEQKVETVTDGLHTSLFTAALLLVRHLSKINNQTVVVDGDTEMETSTPPRPLLQVKLIAHCMNAIRLCDNRPQPTTSTQALFQLSWCLFQEVLDSFSSVDAPFTTKPKLRMSNAVQLNPFVKEFFLEHDQQGIGALFHLLVQRFRPSSYSKEVAARQEEACQVLRGLVAVVWNPDNAELCQRVMLTDGKTLRSSSRLRLLSMLATQLLPLLHAQMEREAATTKLRGYMVATSDDANEDKDFNRSRAHRMWCLVLDFVGGLLRLQTEATGIESDDADVWDFVSHAESLLLVAVQPTTCQRLTRAVVAEHQALLRFIGALSETTSRRKRWRQAFPANSVVLMEQSRQLLRRACVLLGSSLTEISRLRKEKVQKQKSSKSASSKSVAGVGASLSLIPKSPRSPRSPSSFTYAHQTLLHDHLQAVREAEKRHLTEFHHDMEAELVEVVRLASSLLIKWTGSLTDRDAILVVNGVRYVDEEQLVPLLGFVPPSEARSMNSNPGLGHLTLAMDFMLDQLVLDDDDSQGEQTAKSKGVLTNAIDTCALLFLKTYLLYTEQYELVKRDRDELGHFFRQFNARLSGDKSGASVAVDAQLAQHIGKVCTRR